MSEVQVEWDLACLVVFFPLPFVGTWEVKEQQLCVVSAREKGECLCAYREERDGQKIQPCCSSDSVTAEAGARVA